MYVGEHSAFSVWFNIVSIVEDLLVHSPCSEWKEPGNGDSGAIQTS